MTPKTIKDAIKTRVNTELEVAQSYTIQYDNVDKATPDNAAWIRVTILPGQSSDRSVGSPGSNVIRHMGIVVFQIFTPINTGDKDAYDIQEIIRTSFKPATYGGVKYKAATVTRVGEEDSWSQINVDIPYQADELV